MNINTSKTKPALINSAELSFLSLPANESFSRLAVAAFVSQLNPAIDELSDLKTAVSEAVTNAIVHGYRGVNGTIYISMKAFSNRSVRIRIRDRGIGISDIGQAMEPLFTTDPDGERGGMGFTVMRSFTDRLTVSSAPGKGTSVTMTKYLRSPIG